MTEVAINGDAGAYWDYQASVNGETRTLRFQSLDLIPGGILRRHRNDEEQQMWAMFEWGLSGEDLEFFDLIPIKQYPEIIRQWQEASGADLGKSVQSSTSAPINRAARRSKQTSSR